MYYYSMGGEDLEGVSRPYFMFVIGDRDVLASINKRVPFSEVKHGIANYCAFTTYDDVNFDMTNEFGVARKNMLECRSDAKGKCHLKLKANLLTTLQDDTYVMNPENYRTQNATVSVGAVERMDDTQSPYTHVFTIDLDGKMNPSGEQLRLIQQETPNWLEAVNDDTGKNVRKNLEKTTGIKYIIGGIADAYKNDKLLTNIKFNIVKN